MKQINTVEEYRNALKSIERMMDHGANDGAINEQFDVIQNYENKTFPELSSLIKPFYFVYDSQVESFLCVGTVNQGALNRIANYLSELEDGEEITIMKCVATQEKIDSLLEIGVV